MNIDKVVPMGLALALLFTACAEERPPINRVQPYAMDKTWFVGDNLLDTSDDPEFWTQATLIDVGYGAAQSALFTSTYAQPMSRIKWQITEDMLIGRIAYERIDDSDGRGVGGATQDGVIAAAFRIVGHFDIENAYNPTTGERLNIINENSVDRPWYDRAYFRVDWSKNLNVGSYDFDTLSLIGIYGGVTYSPMAYDVTDPNDPDAPVFDLDANGYFDVTTRAFAMPNQVDLGHLGWGINSFPACFLPADFAGGSAPAGSCNPVELTVRHSFRRVEDTDYEPADWDGHRFSAYGAFTTERAGYARNYGMTDDTRRRFLTRYNIWERSHYYADPEAMLGPVECYTPQTTPFGTDPHRDADGNGTEDECEAVGSGSRCDTFRQRCTLPYQERTPRPIVWYYTQGSDLDYFDGTRRATHEWDVALRTAVRAAQYAECVRVAGNDCANRFKIYSGQQDMNEDAVNLALEVNNCRHGYAYPERSRNVSECLALADEIGAKRGYDPAVIDIAKMNEMVVLCHSPVESGDPRLCGGPRLPSNVTAEDCANALADPWELPRPAGEEFPDLVKTCRAALSARPGDLRYHQVNVVATPQTPSPWGIYTDSEDPLTGETVAASINVWAHVNDLFSQSVIDKIRYLEGEITTAQITDGEYVRNWSQAASAASSGGFSPRYEAHEVEEKIAEFAGVDPAEMEHMEVPESMRQQAIQLIGELSHVKASVGAPSQNRARLATYAAQLAGTPIEAELMTPMVQQMMGIGGLPLTDEVMDRASPLRGGHPELARDLERRVEAALADRGTCIRHEAPAPLAMVGLAKALQQKFGRFNPEDDPGVQQARAERMRRYVAERGHTAVIMHEMGHSVGLRHNFVSSSDALNYRPQYWQLRTKNGAVERQCDSLVENGESCVGPRYHDPVSAEERDNLLPMFMHSSVMDYAGEITQDFMGLGVYDFAAARMFYGETVAVFGDEDVKAGSNKAAGLISKLDNFGGILGFTWFAGAQSTMHYSALQSFYDLISDCREVEAADYAPAGWDEEKGGAWHPVLDGGLVAVDGRYTRCDTRPVDYARWVDLRRPQRDEEGVAFRGGPAIDREARIRVPYGFGTDSWADLGNLSVYRHDNGADPYELFDFFISKQEVDHIFDNYRRNRAGFSVRGAANRSVGRYNAKLRDAAKGLGLYRNIFSKSLASEGFNPDEAWPIIASQNFGGNILAAGMAFDHFARMLARPEHGPHYLDDADQVVRSKRDAFFLTRTPNTDVVVPNGPTGVYRDVGIGGRPVENTLANDQGEYDTQYTMNAGSYYEKMYASMLFTESADNFVSASRTDFVDGRYRAVSLADLFPDGYRRLLANALTGDDFIKGPRLAANRQGQPLVDGDNYPERPIGWVTWWGTEPRVCFNDRGTQLCSSVGNEDGDDLDPVRVRDTVALDPQIGWEQHKFLVVWTLLYLLSNQQQEWVDMMRLWEMGLDADPQFGNRIELHLPDGKHYVAKTYGTETLFGREVQRGVAARVLEYANGLLAAAYEVDDGPDLNGNGEPDWYLPILGADGTPVVRYDQRLQPSRTCNAENNAGCTCSANLACLALADYAQLPWYLQQTVRQLGIGTPSPRGLY